MGWPPGPRPTPGVVVRADDQPPRLERGSRVGSPSGHSATRLLQHATAGRPAATVTIPDGLAVGLRAISRLSPGLPFGPPFARRRPKRLPIGPAGNLDDARRPEGQARLLGAASSPACRPSPFGPRRSARA